MKRHSITILERKEVSNPAKYNWLYLYDEPLAGNSSICKVIGDNVIVSDRRAAKFKRGQLVRKLRNKAKRKLSLASKVIKFKNKRTLNK